MTDLEITQRCAEAMGISKDLYAGMCSHCDEYSLEYDPLHDDEQAMALVKKFELDIHRREDDWCAVGKVLGMVGYGKDLNRAICECVAKMEA